MSHRRFSFETGIGNATILEQYGITARLDLDTVGENLQVFLSYSARWKMRFTKNLLSYQDHYGVLVGIRILHTLACYW